MGKEGAIEHNRVRARYQMKLTIDLDAEMQSNFGDIRFYDLTASAELPYWIEKIDTTVNPTQATVWVKTGANNNIYMYYGNLQPQTHLAEMQHLSFSTTSRATRSIRRNGRR